MEKLNIYVISHKKSRLLLQETLSYLQVGSNNDLGEGWLRDNSGDNISNLNPYFCELTGIYWAWKNTKSDYYGFMHYRRFFSFNKDENRPVVYEDNISDLALEKHKIFDQNIQELVGNFDLILPIHENFQDCFRIGNSMKKQYKLSPHEEIEDFNLALEILHNKHPEFDKYVKKGLSAKRMYLYNMFIMKSDLFNSYCEWLFPIVFELHEKTNYEKRSIASKRMVGYVSERLFSIYVCYLKATNKNLKVKELPVVFFENTEDPYLLPIRDKKAICLASDDNYFCHLALTISSLLDNASNEKFFYDIVILDNGISLKNKKILLNFNNRAQNVSIRIIKTSEYLKGYKLSSRDHINLSTYIRFVIFDFLKNYEKVLYLDCDLVINHDVSVLFDINLNGKSIAAVRDTTMCTWNTNKNFKRLSHASYLKNDLKLNNVYDYFNAGVVLFDVNEILKNNITVKSLFELAVSREWKWLDQDILNYLFKDKVYYLEGAWNLLSTNVIKDEIAPQTTMPEEIYKSFKKASNSPFIIHYAGQKQPIFVDDAEYSDIYWKYARNCPVYEQILKVYLTRKTNKKTFKQKMKDKYSADSKFGKFIRYIYSYFK